MWEPPRRHLGSPTDGFGGGRARAYSVTIRPAIQLVGLRAGVSRASALQLLALKDRLVFCADTMVNIDPSAEELAEIAILAAEAIGPIILGIRPPVAVPVACPATERAYATSLGNLARRPL